MATLRWVRGLSRAEADGAAFSVVFQLMCLRAQRRKIYPLAPADQVRDLIAQCFSVGLPVDKADEQEGPRRARTTRTDFREVSDQEAARLRDKIRTWFFHAKVEDIREDNVREVRRSIGRPR